MSLLDQAREAEAVTIGEAALEPRGIVTLPVEARDALVELADAAEEAQAFYALPFNTDHSFKSTERLVACLERLRR